MLGVDELYIASWLVGWCFRLWFDLVVWGVAWLAALVGIDLVCCLVVCWFAIASCS